MSQVRIILKENWSKQLYRINICTKQSRIMYTRL